MSAQSWTVLEIQRFWSQKTCLEGFQRLLTKIWIWTYKSQKLGMRLMILRYVFIPFLFNYIQEIQMSGLFLWYWWPVFAQNLGCWQYFFKKKKPCRRTEYSCFVSGQRFIFFWEIIKLFCWSKNKLLMSWGFHAVFREGILTEM